MSDFTHLHLHTEYSLLDGANKIKELAKTLKEQGVKSAAITDHGNMFGAIDFYQTMKKEGIKPLIGIEAYIHNQDELNDKSTKQRFHLILIAKNQTGYKNLMYLSSMSYVEGFYYYPRINKKILKEHSEGVICTAACLQGEVSWHLNLSERNLKYGAKGYEKAKEVALEYKEIFGDDFYLEIMRHGIGDQRRIDDDILKISRETGIKVIATNDTHYTFKERADAHEVFMCIAMNKNLDDPNRLRHSVHEFFVKTPKQMNELFLDIPEAIENTQEIVNKCNLELDLGNPTPPNFKFTIEYANERGLELPEPQNRYSFVNDAVFFEYECKKGLEERLKFVPQEQHEMYRSRLKTEIDIINKMNFPGYMMIVWDFINEAKKRGIPVGPGRGSAAGSLVAYSLKITDLDPIPYSLLFERFLNPERVSMPDIDVDFCQTRRGEIIDYVTDKYGKFNVAGVITFGKLLAKGVIRDVARVCGMPYAEADTMAKLIPDELGITLKDAFEKEPKISELISRDGNAARVWKFALDLEGLNRNAGQHAAGVVISNEELWNKTPLFRQPNSPEDHYVTQYSLKYLEDVDLIKFDFLGLKTLTVIDNAIKLVKARTGKDIVWENIDKNDKKVYDMIQGGDAIGIFQIESEGMRKLGTSLKPDCFEDIVAMLALYRPGPMESGMLDDFVKRKHGEAAITYAFPELEPILSPTYGVIVYQEQVMQIVQKIGGFSLGGADLVRRAMGKKDPELLKKQKDLFVEGAIKMGFDADKSGDLFDLILKFAGYGFNKSHSAAYAYVTFQTAYLKAYYPAEFMAALLTSEENNTDKIVRYIDESKRLKIDVVGPDINHSMKEFSVVETDGKDQIIFGFGAIKGVGGAAIESMIGERENGVFKDLDDFVSRVDSFKVNKKVIESLVKSGAMDSFHLTRFCLINNIENILEACKNAATLRKNATESLFGEDESMNEVKVKLLPTDVEYNKKDMLQFEQESVGIYLSGHPLDEYKVQIESIKYTLSSQFDTLPQNSEIMVVGKIEDFSTRITKSGKKMGTINILDFHGSIEIAVFERELVRVEEILASSEEKNLPFAFKINISKDDQFIRAKLNSIHTLSEAGELKFETRKLKQFGNYAKKDEKQAPQKVKEYELLEVILDLNELSKDKITKLYTLGFDEHQAGVDKNNKRLVLKIKNSQTDEIFVYNTEFIVGDNFGQKALNLMAG
ncbi:DNA polymerase III subunit alpha [Campylobacter sp. RM9344]|uniref:DNA polymerase III subunit alpha n=1 Tax=Campylobacter californiensis TaxID=1032243 RepID=A0AAW3ZXZ7_9BACT|nr:MULTISPECIES: DNA polymerase III subunit alpha [unclassified Campylobacter]MBE2984754.1 DNA polymerase III subunit alpha [Campylobacter sp. RM6883]MBE2994670.1 DNA polymerase III subunit alpha [Campylobacter sp. RM6913]MBE3029196.1 DNA polymerase III subunit alpha [Campylobacter sp. RM9344]MBE3608388.1 DNA polymerase III subunit alpha [Campylobacter sp. RM9337]QCD50479.1 DNA polymerase III, alpha subunit [Campylobacter sp. RM6914]